MAASGLFPNYEFGLNPDSENVSSTSPRHHKRNNIALLRTMNASFIAFSDRNSVHIHCDMNRLTDRIHATGSSRPPFSPWQTLQNTVDGSEVTALAWCEELSRTNEDCWLATASHAGISLYAASLNRDKEASVGLPMWVAVHRINFPKSIRLYTLSWSSFFGVRRLLAGGDKLILYVLGERKVEPALVWKAARYPVSGSVVSESKLSMDGRLFATAEKSNRIVRVWFSKHGVHGSYSCAQLSHESAVLKISWRPFLRINARGKVGMIHGTSTRRALMTLTADHNVYIWQESDKCEEFRMFLATTIGDRRFPILDSHRITSAAWVTYTTKHHQFQWMSSSGNSPGASTDEHNPEQGGLDEKKILSKSHGHVVDRRETSVRLGPYAEHFEDSDYIVTLTNSKTILVWVVSGIDAQPRCSIDLKLWGTAEASCPGSIRSNIVKACCFLSHQQGKAVQQLNYETGIVEYKNSEPSGEENFIPEPIRLCLMVQTGVGTVMEHRALWVEWDANRPLSVAGKAAYDHPGISVEKNLFDLGHSFPIVGLFRIRDGGSELRDFLTLDSKGHLKLWDCHNESGVSLCDPTLDTQIPTTQVQCVATYSGYSAGNDTNGNRFGCLFIASLGKIQVYCSGIYSEDGSSCWKLVKTVVFSAAFVVHSMFSAQGATADDAFAVLVSAETNEVKILRTNFPSGTSEIVHESALGPAPSIKFSALFSHSLLPAFEIITFDANGHFGSNKFERLPSPTASEYRVLDELEFSNHNVLQLSALSDSTMFAVLAESLENSGVAVHFFQSSFTRNEFEPHSVLNLGYKLGRISTPSMQWIYLFGHDPTVCASNDSGGFSLFAQRCTPPNDRLQQSLSWYEIARSAEESSNSLFIARNNGDIISQGSNGFKLYDKRLFIAKEKTDADPSATITTTPSSSLEDRLAERSCVIEYTPQSLMANVYLGNVYRVRGILTHLRDILGKGVDRRAPRLPLPSPGLCLKRSKKFKIGESLKGAQSDGLSFSSYGTGSAAMALFDDSRGAESEDLRSLPELINMTRRIPGLSKREKITLSAFVEAFLDIFGHAIVDEKAPEQDETPVGKASGMDNHASKYLLALKVYDVEKSMSRGNTKIRSVKTKDIAFATTSESTNMLLPLCIPHDATWNRVRETGAALWVLDNNALCSMGERVARQQFLQNDRDPNSCLLLYAALGKSKVVAGLFKLKREEKKYLFFMNDFSQERWKSAALKNAYALMKQHKYELAAAFFILGGKILESARVIEKNMGDVQLALFIIRVFEHTSVNVRENTITKEWIEGRLVEFAREKNDYWLLYVAYKLLDKTSDIKKELANVANGSNTAGNGIDKTIGSTLGEKWLGFCGGFEPEHVILYDILDNSVQGTPKFDSGSTPENDREGSGGSIFDSFEFSRPPVRQTSIFDSFDMPSAASQPAEENAIPELDDDTPDQKLAVFVAAMKLYAGMGFPLIALELAGNISNGSENKFHTAAIEDFSYRCVERLVSLYLDAATSERTDDDILPTVLDLLLQNVNNKRDNRLLESFYVNRLYGSEKQYQALILSNALVPGNESRLGKLPAVAKHLSCMLMLSARNGMLLSSPNMIPSRTRIFDVWRRHTKKILSIVQYCDDRGLWGQSAKGSEEYLQLGRRHIVLFTSVVVALRLAWHFRQIVLMSKMLCQDDGTGNDDFFARFMSSPKDILELLQPPPDYFYGTTSYETTCVRHILSTLSMEWLWSSFVKTLDFHDGTELADLSLDSLLAHCREGRAAANKGSPASSEHFFLGAFYDIVIEEVCAVESLMSIVPHSVKCDILSKNFSLEKMWSALKVEHRLQNRAESLETTDKNFPVEVSNSGETEPTEGIESVTSVEIVKTSHIPIVSFCFDNSDPMNTFLTVATENGLFDTNIDSSLRFRPRDGEGGKLLDNDDLSWAKSRERFWQEENDLLEQSMVDLASRENKIDMFEWIDRGNFKVERRAHAAPSMSDLEHRTVDSMMRMNAGRSLTVDDLQASSIESHNRFPFYICGNGLGQVSLWAFGEEDTRAFYTETVDRSRGINRVRFNGLGDKFAACDQSGVVKFWQFSSHPATLDPYECIVTDCEAVKDTVFLNSGSVVALAGTTSEKHKGTLQLWDTLLPPASGNISSFRPKDFDSADCTSLLFLPFEQLLITGYGSGRLAAYDIRRRVMLDNPAFGKKGKRHNASVVDICHSQELNLFATASADGNIKIWDSLLLVLVKDLGEELHDAVTCVKFTGKYLYSSGVDGKLLRHEIINSGS